MWSRTGDQMSPTQACLPRELAAPRHSAVDEIIEKRDQLIDSLERQTGLADQVGDTLQHLLGGRVVADAVN